MSEEEKRTHISVWNKADERAMILAVDQIETVMPFGSYNDLDGFDGSHIRMKSGSLYYVSESTKTIAVRMGVDLK